jgi:RNA polymerase sigma factor (sigma-70 family)
MTNEQLVICIKAGENVADNMSQLWEQTRRFIHVMATRYQGQAEIEDLEQEGYLALFRAVRGYNPAAGCLFLTYASNWIQQRMVRYIQNNGSIRVPVRFMNGNRCRSIKSWKAHF